MSLPPGIAGGRLWLRLTLISVSLAALVLLLYSPALHYPYVDFDDLSYILQNPHVTAGLTKAGVVWAFTTLEQCNWNPLLWLSHMLIVQLFGLSPAPQHAANILLHGANVVLFFLLLRLATAAIWRSALAAALFAIHPIHIESVAWISERKDVLSIFFVLLAFHAYFSYCRKPGISRYLLVFAAMAAALMTKAMAVTLPFLFLLADFWPLQRMDWLVSDAAPNAGSSVEFPRCSWKQIVREKIPFLFLSLASCYITIVAQASAHALDVSSPFSYRIRNALLGYAGYLKKIFWPTEFAAFYPLARHIPWPHAAAAFLLLFAITLFCVHFRSRRYLLFGWLFFLISLLPVVGLLQVGEQAMADRYMYLPALGLYILFAWGLAELIQQLSISPLIPFTLTVLLIIALSTIHQQTLSYWRDGVALFSHAEKIAPEPSAKIELDLGIAYDDDGLHDQALEHFRTAMELAPETFSTHLALGIHLAENNQPLDAMPEFASALGLTHSQWSRLMVLHSLANTHLILKNYMEANQLFTQILGSDPKQYDSLVGRGRARFELADFNGAEDDYLSAIRQVPSSDLYLWLGRCYQAGQKPEPALHAFQLGLQYPAPPEIAARLQRGIAELENRNFVPTANSPTALPAKMASPAHSGKP